MKSAIITLLTDFGTKDHYVASMKGVILKINPRCILIDITHQVKPHDIEEGAFILANAYSSFPKGTIHLTVIDPEVGGARKPILLETANYFFIGPDNGLFTFAVKREEIRKGVALTNEEYFLPQISSTFHGRDIFAPVAGYLSLGIKPETFGHKIKSWAELSFPKPKMKEGELIGEILHIDAFGNLISNIRREQLFDFAKGYSLVIRVGRRTIQGLKKGYWEVKRSELIALIGSGGFLEISIREGNAQKILKMKKGDKIQVIDLTTETPRTKRNTTEKYFSLSLRGEKISKE
jgi:S-adenosylmethionine hydrolase